MTEKNKKESEKLLSLIEQNSIFQTVSTDHQHETINRLKCFNIADIKSNNLSLFSVKLPLSRGFTFKILRWTSFFFSFFSANFYIFLISLGKQNQLDSTIFFSILVKSSSNSCKFPFHISIQHLIETCDIKVLLFVHSRILKNVNLCFQKVKENLRGKLFCVIVCTR